MKTPVSKKMDRKKRVNYKREYEVRKTRTLANIEDILVACDDILRRGDQILCDREIGDMSLRKELFDCLEKLKGVIVKARDDVKGDKA